MLLELLSADDSDAWGYVKSMRTERDIYEWGDFEDEEDRSLDSKALQRARDSCLS